MALVSVAEAARLVGKNRKTLYGTYIKTGRLSCVLGENGEKNIDTSELLRVFGSFKEKQVVSGEIILDDVSTLQVKNNKEHKQDMSSAIRIAILESENKQLKARLEDKDKHIASVENAMRLLENKSEQRREQHRVWWKFWK